MYKIELNIANFNSKEFQNFISTHIDVLIVQALGTSPSGFPEFRFIGPKSIIVEFLIKHYNENLEYFIKHSQKI